MANQQHPLPGGIQSLPYDIIVLILKSLDSFPTLLSLILTSSVFNNVFNQFPDSIARSIIFNDEFPPEALQVLNLCRPPYDDTSLPERPDSVEIYSGGLTKKISPAPLISQFARNFLRRTKSTDCVRSKIGKIDYDLSPDPHFFGYWEARRLRKNAATVKEMAPDFRDRCEDLERFENGMVRAYGKKKDHRFLERAIYNMYLLGGSVYSTLPFEMQHFKQVDASGFDSLWVFDVPYAVVKLMEIIVKEFGYNGRPTWDLATRFRETDCLEFGDMVLVALTTQIIAGDALALQGESKPYGHETSREELKERVEILRSMMENDAGGTVEFPYLRTMQRINWAWLTVDIGENHKRDVLFVNGPYVGSSQTAESTIHALRQKYIHARKLSKDYTAVEVRSVSNHYNLEGFSFSVDEFQLEAWGSLSVLSYNVLRLLFLWA